MEFLRKIQLPDIEDVQPICDFQNAGIGLRTSEDRWLYLIQSIDCISGFTVYSSKIVNK